MTDREGLIALCNTIVERGYGCTQDCTPADCHCAKISAEDIEDAGWVPPTAEAEDRETARGVVEQYVSAKMRPGWIDRLEGAITAALAAKGAQMQAQIDTMKESVHYANGVADLAMKHRDAAEAALERARAELRECEEYLDNRADADGDSTGFTPNKEMSLLVEVRAALESKPC